MNNQANKDGFTFSSQSVCLAFTFLPTAKGRARSAAATRSSHGTCACLVPDSEGNVQVFTEYECDVSYSFFFKKKDFIYF